MLGVTSPESQTDPPKWLEALENKRKRPHRLAHDIGAGAPCLVCKEGCKGLNLHFWRKLCIECKCRKEDHDVVEEEDYAQFEILFGAKKVKRTTLKFNTQQKIFDWIPPNVPLDLAVDYMKALPQSKLPISDSEGAKYRKKQLEKQLPLHDVDPNACHELTNKEMEEFQKYLNNLKNNVIGQGQIMKFQKVNEERLIQSFSSGNHVKSENLSNPDPETVGLYGRLVVDKMTDMNKATSEKRQAELFPADGVFKTNVVNSSQAHTEYAGGQPSSSYPIHLLKSSQTNFQPLMSQALEKNKNINKLPHLVGTTISGPKPFSTSLFSDTDESHALQKGSNINIQPGFGLRKPSSFVGRKPATCDHENNFLQQDHNCNDKLDQLPTNDTLERFLQPSDTVNSDSLSVVNGISRKLDAMPYRSIPQDASMCKDALSQFNELNVSCDEVPFVPVQESQSISPKRRDGDRHQDRFAKVPGDRHQDVLSVSQKEIENFPVPPQTCRQCLQILTSDDIVVSTERGGQSALWHARCFVCETCKELLVDLMYFFNKGKVYCGRHFAELMNIPRCSACDELIFVKEYTCAEGESFHIRHFCCYHCDEPLAGKQYIPKDGQPVCLPCFQSEYGKNCHTCKTSIAAGEQRVSWKELDFHVSPQCFRCTKCLKSLLGGRFVVKDNSPFCSKECVQEFVL